MHTPRWLAGHTTARAVRDSRALLAVGAVYWLEIYPQVRRELAEWERRAQRIPDSATRQQALGKLISERLNPEAAALFAVLAPRLRRRRVVSLIVAYQVLYDYLDAINEENGCTELRNGLQLHRALTDAVSPNEAVSDHYRYHPKRDDGGYVRALIDVCRRSACALPTLDRIAPVLVRATERCAEAQSHNHAIVSSGESPLIDWSTACGRGRDYEWWELAAGGISCLGIHALLAGCADPRTTRRDAADVDGVYFPSVCALSALLDSLADYHSDLESPNHSFVSHYRDSSHAAQRLARISAEATQGVRRLRQSHRHAIILTGIRSYYLSSAIGDGFPTLAASRLVDGAGPLAAPMMAVLRVRRRLHAKVMEGASTSIPARRRLFLKRQPRRRA